MVRNEFHDVEDIFLEERTEDGCELRKEMHILVVVGGQILSACANNVQDLVRKKTE